MRCNLKITGFILFLLGLGMLLEVCIPASTLLPSLIFIALGLFILLKK
jgi:hypothetical protein